MPKLSVLLPVYNGVDNYPGSMLHDSIYSILRLDVDLELIVINDGSTDETFKQLTVIWKDCSIMRVINKPHNTGQASALNVGLEAAAGEYIWQWSVRATAHKDAVQLVKTLDKYPDVGFVYGQMKSHGNRYFYTHRPPRIFDRQRFIDRYLCNFYMYRRMTGLQYVAYVQLIDGPKIGICDRDMVMQLMDRGAVGMGLHDTQCVIYYNGGRHTLHDVRDRQDEIDAAFRKRWRHMNNGNA